MLLRIVRDLTPEEIDMRIEKFEELFIDKKLDASP